MIIKTNDKEMVVVNPNTITHALLSEGHEQWLLVVYFTNQEIKVTVPYDNRPEAERALCDLSDRLAR